VVGLKGAVRVKTLRMCRLFTPPSTLFSDVDAIVTVSPIDQAVQDATLREFGRTKCRPRRSARPTDTEP
jgi:hypothetical protein